jgi:hypothetical protein
MTLEEMVHDAIQRRIDNGYPINNEPPAEVAMDIASYDADFEDIDAAELISYVMTWLAKHP